MFPPDPTAPGATPTTSHNLAQRNLLIVQTANPGRRALVPCSTASTSTWRRRRAADAKPRLPNNDARTHTHGAILDALDPWIKGAGEFNFRARACTPRQRRDPAGAPAAGDGSLSDLGRPSRNVVELGATGFEGYVVGRLALEVTDVELDTFDPDDTVHPYRRVFAGPSATWLGSYGPGDEVIEPEDLGSGRLLVPGSSGPDRPHLRLKTSPTPLEKRRDRPWCARSTASSATARMRSTTPWSRLSRRRSARCGRSGQRRWRPRCPP